MPRPEAMSTQGVQAPSPSPLKLLLGHRAAPKPPPEHAPVLPLPQVVQFASTNDAGRLYGADTGHARQLLAAATDALYRPAGHGMHGHAAVWARPVGLNRPRGHSVETRMDNRRPSSEPTPTSDIIRRAMAAYDNAHKKQGAHHLRPMPLQQTAYVIIIIHHRMKRSSQSGHVRDVVDKDGSALVLVPFTVAKGARSLRNTSKPSNTRT